MYSVKHITHIWLLRLTSNRVLPPSFCESPGCAPNFRRTENRKLCEPCLETGAGTARLALNPLPAVAGHERTGADHRLAQCRHLPRQLVWKRKVREGGPVCSSIYFLRDSTENETTLVLVFL